MNYFECVVLEIQFVNTEILRTRRDTQRRSDSKLQSLKPLLARNARSGGNILWIQMWGLSALTADNTSNLVTTAWSSRCKRP